MIADDVRAAAETLKAFVNETDGAKIPSYAEVEVAVTTITAALDRLEARIAELERELAEIEEETRFWERHPGLATRLRSDQEILAVEARVRELEEALRQIVAMDGATWYDDPFAGFAAVARRALSSHSGGEPRRYTLEEARMELAREKCERLGHAYEVIVLDWSPMRVICTRCGCSWAIRQEEES